MAGEIRDPGTRIVETAVSIGTTSAPSAKAVLELVSTTKGFLPPRMTTTQRDNISSPGAGNVVYNTSTNKLNVYNGSSWVEAGSGGGGSALVWVESANAPLPSIENNIQIYSFETGLEQSLYAHIKVPASYVAGVQIFLRMLLYSGDSSGDGLMQTVATLIRTGTDAVSSTTNQRTSTNSAVTFAAGTVNEPQAVSFDLTDSSGQINSVAVSAGDSIFVQMKRGTDTATGDIKVPVYGAEATFTS